MVRIGAVDKTTCVEHSWRRGHGRTLTTALLNIERGGFRQVSSNDGPLA